MVQGGSNNSHRVSAELVAKEFEIASQKVQEVTDYFLQQINHGLKDKHAYQIPSFVTQIPTGQEKGLVLAVDLGGTNCRVCAVTLHGDSTLDVLQQKHVIPADIRVNSSHKPLFNFIAEKIQQLLKDDALQESKGSQKAKGYFDLGFTFSFTCEQTSISRGTLVHWDKGWGIPSTVGQDPCALLQEAIDEIGLPVRVCVLANDAVGTLLARAYTSKRKNSTLASIILGTGTNAAYVERMSNIQRLENTTKSQQDGIMVINTEWGCWDDGLNVLPHTQFDKLVDESSSDPGCGLLEKMVSGMYLGELLRLVLLELSQNDALSMAFEKDSFVYVPMGIETSFLTKIAEFGSDTRSALSYMSESLRATGVTDQDLRQVQMLASAIVQRSARLVGAGLAAIIIQSGRLGKTNASHKTTTEAHAHEVDQKPRVQTPRQPPSISKFIRRIFGCIIPPKSPPISTSELSHVSKDTLGSSALVDDIIDIAVDGSLFEFHAEFENFMRSSLRDVAKIGVHEANIIIELTRDGSGTGAALIAAAAKEIDIEQ
ncbi:putative glucokinase [Fusarium austroafricanum]|uniref:Phosphotransferase n=1 Tax=Fusarium austroafricanum TaxID=2364996 RepID=A0A8H4NVQ3_9HYPO|nr:putative glucokinase [Fusarium austroafricanum]